jgi:hypothetical protein
VYQAVQAKLLDLRVLAEPGLDEATGRIGIAKVATTPRDLTEG